MADFDNLSEMKENFDTIKTLLNSIRAQGILNTSDVDKLLSGINTKLEKINTEEDIDLIKIFLSELKQNLDERHGVLVSKFGAIESLFSNLLKNSSEMPKSSELKELFDIVATNLSVFSREVVSQKESLTEISMRLEALRSDDSQKKDIIKNIALLKGDLERLSNGFDSIVISLNDNFKTVVKTISSIDKTEYLDRFSDSLSSIEMSSNTVLSALQMLGKKSDQLEDALVNLATKDDIASANQKLFDLAAQGHEISSYVSDMNDRYSRLDNLAEKIDASVNIIATLKSVMEENEDKNARSIIEEFKLLEVQVRTIVEDTKFEEFKLSLEGIFRKIVEGTAGFENELKVSNEEIAKLSAELKNLDISVELHKLANNIDKSELEVKTYIDEVAQKAATLQDANITRVLNDISTNADTIASKIAQTQSSISVLCEKNFSSVYETITELKGTVSQLDENTVSANNAIFSSITDRLSVFENSLKTSLDAQEKTVNYSSAQLVEQFENIKNLTSVLDYKMDSSVIEVGNVKREFSNLKSAVEDVLALDFVNAVKDLRVDLYASKQEMMNSFENSGSELSEKFTSDLYGKYELLISKLDAVEDEIKKTQAASLNSLKPILENITSSIVDVLSYVSEAQSGSVDNIDSKLNGISNIVRENTVEFIENVRDVVDVIRTQVETNLKNIEDENAKNFDAVKKSISENSQDLKKDIKYSYSKLLEIQDSYNEIKEIINLNAINSTDRFDGVISTADGLKAEFDTKLGQLKSSLIDKISEFKQEFTCENADTVSELKFSVENLYAKGSTEVVALLNELKTGLSGLSVESNNARAAALAKLLENFNTLKEYVLVLNNQSAETLAVRVQEVTDEFAGVKSALEKLDENIDADITRQLSILESNFETLMSQITILFDKSELTLAEKISNGFSDVSAVIENSVNEKLEDYKKKIETSFAGLEKVAEIQSNSFKSSISNLNDLMKSAWLEQSAKSSSQLEDLISTMKSMLEDNTKISQEEYATLKTKMSDLIAETALNNDNLVQEVKTQLDNLDKAVASTFENHEKKVITGFAQIKSVIGSATEQEITKMDLLEEQINVSVKALGDNFELTNNNISKRFDNAETIAKEHLEISTASKNDLSTLIQLATNNSEFIGTLENVSKEKFNELSEKAKSIQNSLAVMSSNAQESADLLATTKSDIAVLAQAIATNKVALSALDESLNEKASLLKTLIAEASAGELQALDAYANALQEQIDASKKTVELCKDTILQVLQKELNIISTSVEKETDVIIAELVEQFDLLKRSQADEIVNLTSRIEDIVNSHVYNSIEDLKSYLDVKTDKSDIIAKVDNFKLDISNSISDVMENVSKMLDVGVFSSSISDFRLANEILINSSLDRLQEKFETFVSENTEALADLFKSNNKSLEERLGLFDKKFAETVVDKFEEIKIVSAQYNKSLEEVQVSLSDIITRFEAVKENIAEQINDLASTIKNSTESTNKEIAELSKCFADLRSQISSKSFDEAFQASINKQIAELETLIAEQMNYLEDISELCVNNLPDITELNTLVKYNVLESIKEFSTKMNDIKAEVLISMQDSEGALSEEVRTVKSDVEDFFKDIDNSVKIYQSDMESAIRTSELAITNDLKVLNSDFGSNLKDIEDKIEAELNTLKSDVITQILNVFNQISFVAEQEEILDFIQDKHDELITILSHIVTSTNDIYDVKKQVTSVDNKMSTIKDEIKILNEKINSIISSEDEVDYIYSLHDLESDIANLRIALNEIKENDFSKEFSDLVNSTDEIYALVESIKDELPSKKAFEGLSEDIVSISTRTNKLILASDESYKALQENLQDFKLVIDDLDERTRNFSREAGIDRIDNKLNAINQMMQNGSKTNQVFNQVFEYLAEWVDNASTQINTISSKVETLDDIEQIKSMLSDLKNEASDNSETEEMIEALGAVFSKQTKRISSLETKLDRIIVDNTINNDKKVDITPLEDTLNRFLVAIDEKMVSQQQKINSLEAKLEGVLSLLDEKDTAQLTKKVGGMDRQIAKLNKSIEKIASHVVEK